MWHRGWDLDYRVSSLMFYSCLFHGLGLWDRGPWPGILPRPPPLGAWSLSYWTTHGDSPAFFPNWFKKKKKREILVLCFFIIPGGSNGKESAGNAGDPGLIPRLRRSPGEGNGNPFQHSCLGNPMDRGAWWAIVHGVTKSWTWLTD